MAGEPVLLIISGEPAGDSLGLLLGLALEFTVIPESKDVSDLDKIVSGMENS